MKKLGVAAIFFRLASSGFAQLTQEQTVRDSSVSLLLPQADDEFWSPGDACRWFLHRSRLIPSGQGVCFTTLRRSLPTTRQGMCSTWPSADARGPLLRHADASGELGNNINFNYLAAFSLAPPTPGRQSPRPSFGGESSRAAREGQFIPICALRRILSVQT
jgi:hypothetical protein